MGRPVRYRLPEKRVTEIRVHGVGGTPPEDMLDDPHPDQVTGDRFAGFFRKAKEEDPNRHVEAYSWGGLTSRSVARSLWLLLLPFTLVNVGGWMVEADVDAPRDKRQWHAEIQERAIRVIAALMSVSFVAWIAAITVDVVAYQCARRAPCREGHWWLGFAGNDFLLDHPGIRILIGVTAALGVFALVDVIAKRARNNFEEWPPDGERGVEAGDQATLENNRFWWRPSLVRDLAWFHRGAVGLTIAGASAYALSEFESGSGATWLVRTGQACLLAGTAYAVGTAALRRKRVEIENTSPRSWKHFVGVAAAAGVFIALAVHEVAHTPQPDVVNGVRTLAVFRRLPFALLFAEIAVAMVALGAQLSWWYKRRSQWSGLANAGAVAGLVVGLLLVFVSSVVAMWVLVIAAAVAMALATRQGRRTVLFFLAPAALTIGLIAGNGAVRDHYFVIVAIEAIVVTVVSWILAIDLAWKPDAFRWGGMIVLPLIGAFLLAGTFAGGAFRVVDYLNKGEGSTALPIGGNTEALPPAYDWIAIAVATALVLTLVAAIVLNRQTDHEVKGCDPPCPEGPQPEMPGTGVPLEGDHRSEALGRVRGAITVVRTTRAGDLLLMVLAALTTLVLVRGLRLSVAAAHAQQGKSFWRGVVDPNWWHDLFDASLVPKGWLLTASTWVLAALPALAVLAFRRSTKDESTRRKIGIVWDLGTFWPRRFHPLAPPSYAERAVPELQRRIDDATVDNAGKTVPGKVALLGHSQGSVLSFAALAPRSPAELANVRFVTYGSPLVTFFRRFFPTYFTDQLFLSVASKLPAETNGRPGWVNFHRRTDPIAAPIFPPGLNDPPGCLTGAEPAPDEVVPEQQWPGLDQPLYDPWWWWDVPGQPGPGPLGHSNYLDDPEMFHYVERIWDDL